MKRTIICDMCGKESYKRSNGNQKFCIECSKIAEKKRKRNWYIKNEQPTERKFKRDRFCSYCGSKVNVSRFKNGNLYCGKHYNEMYRFGEIRNLNGRRKKNECEIRNDYVVFKTTRGVRAYIDLEDINLIKNHYWGINSQGYLHSRVGDKLIRLHREILDVPKHKEVDHINRNKLDNRKSNLRICEKEENGRNQPVKRNNRTGVPGVSEIKTSGKWRSRISIDGKEINLGYYDNFFDAVDARKQAEEKYFGDYAPKYDTEVF